MKLFTYLTLLTATVLATPVVKAPKEFHLKTAGAKNAKHNNLFIYTYHTGAGFNDAVLDKDGTNASRVYLNGTQALVDLDTEYPWGFIVPGDTNYASWEAIEINAGGGNDGFSIKNGNFVWSEASGFGGWLVCDWYHNAPQLFYLNKYYTPVIPSSCSKVQLKPIYVK
ncbi:hypothetical protein N7462_003981 [Penicillium macrosclerotiorum]|uniref:uncharacterized protein n=1 Tax=Penicillium macrosclerotiorum TaxID=303699 RepID=UPI002548C39B|nr:uncharacterized protein N7462_003981 [Penicillium macrosclerotiorum]KAJ5689589.1 hypothetical protein N7462_003981 [Penicillium macrosclerotiorum]